MKPSDERTSVGVIAAPICYPTSKLVLLCDGIIESTWLAVLMVTPLLFNPHASFSGFTPFKYGFLRFCMFLGLAAAIVRWAGCRRQRGGLPPPARRWWQAPLALPLGLFMVAVMVSTWLSVNRSASFWGGYETAQGLLTWTAGVILLALIATHLRRESQVERLVTVVLVTSFAVSLTAVAQRLGWDPSHPEMARERVASTVGHPIAMAGYLVMLCPLTLWRLWSLWTRQRILRPGPRLAGLVFYLLLLAAQLAAFWAAESRGPWVAMLAALFALFLFWAAYRRRRSWVWGGLAAVCTVVVSGLWVASHGSLARYARLPGMRRLDTLVSLQKGGETFRSELWGHLPAILFTREPFTFPDGRRDAWQVLRFWVGYGPETVESVTPHYFTEHSTIVENRCHNLVWDLWFALGIFGLAAYVGLVCRTMGRGLYSAGILSTAGDSTIFWGLVLLFAAGTGLALSWWVNLGFLGPGLVAGFVAAFTVLTALFWLRGSVASPQARPRASVLVMVLLASVLGHLADDASGFSTAPTGTLCWACLGLILALTRNSRGNAGQRDSEAEPVGTGFPKPEGVSGALNPEFAEPRASVFSNAFLIALGLATLLFGFVQAYSDKPLSVGDILSLSLWHNHPGEFRVSFLLVPVVAFWLAASFMLSLDAEVPGKGRSLLRSWAATAALSGAMALAFALVKARQLAAIGPLPSASSPVSSVMLQARGYENLFLCFTVLSLLLVVLAGVSLTGWRRVATPFSPGELCGLALAGVVVCCAISPLGLRRLRADLDAQWGAILADQGGAEAAVPVFQRALALNPAPAVYRGLLQQALVECAQREPDPAAARQRIGLAVDVLTEGLQSSRLNRLDFVLGQTCLLAAFSEQGPTRLDFARKAAQALDEARVFEPFIESVWTYSAIASSLRPDESDETAKLRQRAKTIASADFYFWGDYYSGLAQNTAVGEFRNRLAAVGLEYFDAGLEAPNLTAADRAHFALAKAGILLATDRQNEAVHELREAEAGARPEDAWQIETILADFELQLSNFAGAREHLELARKSAPRDKLAIIKEMENRLPPH